MASTLAQLPSWRFSQLSNHRHRTASRLASARKDVGQLTRSKLMRSGVALLSLPLFVFTSPSLDAEAAGFDRYIKKRPLEPLQNYVLPLLAAKSELDRAGRIAGNDLDAARSLLREGSLSKLRFNARAVAEYAKRLETSSESDALATDVNRTIERFDDYLLHVSRKQEEERDPMEFVVASQGAIDRLLKTVLQDVMDDVTGKTSDVTTDAS